MVSVQNLSVSFGSFDLLTNISFLINEHDRIGLAGKNGSGKSTLLKIISGIQSPTSGQVDMSKNVTIGYLPQQMKVDDSTTVINEVITAFSELIGILEEIERCSAEIARREDYESADYLRLCDHITVIEERYRMLGGINYLAEAEQTLTGLGFERKDFDRPTKELQTILTLNLFNGLRHTFQNIQVQLFLFHTTKHSWTILQRGQLRSR
jgi:ATP-binding cassette subfamily F protein 3